MHLRAAQESRCSEPLHRSTVLTTCRLAGVGTGLARAGLPELSAQLRASPEQLLSAPQVFQRCCQPLFQVAGNCVHFVTNAGMPGIGMSVSVGNTYLIK